MVRGWFECRARRQHQLHFTNNWRPYFERIIKRGCCKGKRGNDYERERKRDREKKICKSWTESTVRPYGIGRDIESKEESKEGQKEREGEIERAMKLQKTTGKSN